MPLSRRGYSYCFWRRSETPDVVLTPRLIYYVSRLALNDASRHTHHKALPVTRRGFCVSSGRDSRLSRWAHNPEIRGSIPRAATISLALPPGAPCPFVLGPFYS